MKAYIGTVVHSTSLENLQVLPRAAIVVDENGIISAVHEDCSAVEGAANTTIVDLGDRFIFPGLIDTHAHAPQYAQLGLGTGELL